MDRNHHLHGHSGMSAWLASFYYDLNCSVFLFLDVGCWHFNSLIFKQPTGTRAVQVRRTSRSEYGRGGNSFPIPSAGSESKHVSTTHYEVRSKSLYASSVLTSYYLVAARFRLSPKLSSIPLTV